MDFGVSTVIPSIASSTSAYLSAFSPIFLLMGGIALALGVVDWLLDRFFPEKNVEKEMV